MIRLISQKISDSKEQIQKTTRDTFAICIVIVIASLLFNSTPIRILLVACFLMAMVEIVITRHLNGSTKERTTNFYTSLMYFALMFAMIAVSLFHLEAKQYIFCLMLAMASDAGGLFFGRLFGNKKPEFIKNLSPRKTWAGYFGELATTWVCGFVGLHVLKLSASWPNVALVFLGFIACAAGDLLGSGAKRELGVRHSSDCVNRIPYLRDVEKLMRSRHGFLDCVDSVSVMLIFYVVLLLLGRL